MFLKKYLKYLETVLRNIYIYKEHICIQICIYTYMHINIYVFYMYFICILLFYLFYYLGILFNVYTCIYYICTYMYFIHIYIFMHIYTYLYTYMYAAAAAKSLQSCLILCDPMDCTPPGSSVHGILQARILEWVAISNPGICSQFSSTFLH